MKQRNLFIARTAYHLIAAYSICREEYDDKKYENLIYFLKSDRTNYDVLSSCDSFNGEILRFEKMENVALINKLKNQEFKRFFFFQENDILNKYLAYRLKKKGTIICLASDGTKPYGLFNKKHEFFSMLKDTIADYRLLRKYKFILPKLIRSRYYRYGSTSLLDEVWLEYPNLFNSIKNKTKGKIISLPKLTSQHIQGLSNIFNFSNTQLAERDKIILYFNQPFYSRELLDKEFELLDSISVQFPDKKIYIKLHPSTTNDVAEQMVGLPYSKVIVDKLPSEFYLGLISNSILITGWSTALMHDINHQNNKNYYLFPLYKNVKDKVLSQITLLGFPHVEMVENLNQLQFPNEQPK